MIERRERKGRERERKVEGDIEREGEIREKEWEIERWKRERERDVKGIDRWKG